MKTKKTTSVRIISILLISTLLVFFTNNSYAQKSSGYFGDNVWEDNNGNGIQDAGENGIHGVRIIAKKNGSFYKEDYSESDGYYKITYNGTGNYTVEVDMTTVPSYYTASTSILFSQNITSSTNISNFDFGFQDQNSCTVTKANGGGFFTTISSVTYDGSLYSIVLTIEHNGCPGGGPQGCKELSHYSIEADQNTYSGVGVSVLEGGMTYGNIDMGWNLGQDPFNGFKIDNTAGIGDGNDGKFTISYSLTALQAQQTSAKAGNNSQIASFTLAEFQQVYNCTSNNPPVAIDDNYTTPYNTAKSGNVITNDSDPDGDNITVNTTLISGPSHGSVVQNANGTFTYTPTTGYTGTDSYVYEICDDGTPSLCDQATVTITIQASTNNPPVAVNDNYTTPLNTPKSGNVITNDSDPDGDNITVNTTLITNPTHGSVVQNANGTFTYTPTTGYTGTDSYVYEICDDGAPSLCDQATVTITIQAPVNNPPIAVNDNYLTGVDTPVSGNVITNDSDPDGDNITVNTTVITNPTHGSVVQNADGTFTYTPASGYTGTDSYVYEICDDGTPSLCDQATVTITINPGTDTDGDGCTDDVDDYPNDPTRCLDNYFPANGYGTLAYEDLWPGVGDYDFNDLVCDYQFHMVTNSSNKVVEVFGSFIIKAFGASFENGFGFMLADDAIDPTDIVSVSGYDLQEGYINLNANGTEAGQSKATFIIYDNSFNLMPHPGQGIGVNTDPPAPYVNPDTIDIHIDFTNDLYTLDQLNIANFNPFIIVNLQRGVEVHLPNYEPTDLVDQSYFGTFNDDSDPSSGRYYKTHNNLPWAIHIYQSFEYPIEKVDIVNTYLHFVEWAEDNGGSFTDWYSNTDPGYRNEANIYVVP